MENISILIVEDKILIAEGISSMLRKRQFEVAGICETGEEAVAFCKQTIPDLILMDISLGGNLDGISAAEVINKSCSIPIIYLSDYTDRATVDRAKMTFPASYLSKPFNEADLVRHIDIAIVNAQQHKRSQFKTIDQNLLLKTDSQSYVKLKADEILFLEADRSYCNIVTETKSYKLSKSMNHIADQLESHQFMRVSRSSVVNLGKIDGLEGNLIKIGVHRIQMSREYRDPFMRRQKIIR